jgi:hypothetical protein
LSDPGMDRARGRATPGPRGHAAGQCYPGAAADTSAYIDSTCQG